MRYLNTLYPHHDPLLPLLLPFPDLDTPLVLAVRSAVGAHLPTRGPAPVHPVLEVEVTDIADHTRVRPLVTVQVMAGMAVRAVLVGLADTEEAEGTAMLPVDRAGTAVPVATAEEELVVRAGGTARRGDAIWGMETEVDGVGTVDPADREDMGEVEETTGMIEADTDIVPLRPHVPILGIAMRAMAVQGIGTGNDHTRLHDPGLGLALAPVPSRVLVRPLHAGAAVRVLTALGSAHRATAVVPPRPLVAVRKEEVDVTAGIAFRAGAGAGVRVGPRERGLTRPVIARIARGERGARARWVERGTGAGLGIRCYRAHRSRKGIRRMGKGLCMDGSASIATFSSYMR